MLWISSLVKHPLRLADPSVQLVGIDVTDDHQIHIRSGALVALRHRSVDERRHDPGKFGQGLLQDIAQARRLEHDALEFREERVVLIGPEELKPAVATHDDQAEAFQSGQLVLHRPE
jgi:hypothetical protein